MPLQDRALLNDRYRIEGILGQGGFGAVYRATDEELGLRCAVKENLSLSPGSEKQFRREARLLATLRHPNLPRVTNHFVIGAHQYLVMDFVEGEDSSSRLEQQGPLAEGEVLRWIEQVCSALIYLHALEAPIIHRDVKPANIKITPEGQAILVDFGLAKDWAAGDTTSTGAKGITPGFAPPEQYDLGHTDARTDVYALGATLYNLLTGLIPPDSVNRLIGAAALIPPGELRPGVSPHLVSAILRAMEVEAESRFQSAGEFALALADSSYRYPTKVEVVTSTEEERTAERAPSFQLREWAGRALGAARRAFPSMLAAAGVLAALVVVFVGPAALLQGARNLAGLPERPLVQPQVEATLQPVSFARLVATRMPQAGPTLRVAAPTAIVLPTPTPVPAAATTDNAAAWRLFASWRAGAGTVPFIMSPAGDSLLLVDRQGVDTFELRSGTRQDELQGFLVGREVVELAHLGDSVLVQFADEILQYDLSSKNLIQSIRVAGRDMRVSPDGRLLAIREKYVSLLSLESNKLVATLGEEGSSQQYAFSPDGQLFALTRRNNVELYDTRTGRLSRTLAGHGEPTAALTFTTDGRLLVSGSGDVWDVASGELVAVFDSSTSLITVSPNGQLVVGDDGSVWDLNTGELVGEIPVQGAGARRMQFTPDGQFLVRQARDGGIELWTVDPNAALALAEPEPPATLPIGEVITPLNISRLAPVSRLAVTATDRLVISPGWTTAATWNNSTVILTSLVSGEELQRIRISGEILDVAYLGDGFLMVINASRQVERWEVGTGRLKQTYDYLGHRLEASAQGGTFAVQEKYIQVVDAVTGERLHNLGSAVAIEQLYPDLLGTGADLTDLGQDFVFAPDGEHLAIAFGSGVSLWDIQTGKGVRQFSGHGPDTGGLSFSPDGSRLLSASGDLWEVASGERITEFEVQADGVAISPSGNLIAGSDGSLWDGHTGQYLGSLGVEAAALWFTPNDRQLIVQTRTGSVVAYGIKPKLAHSAPPSSTAAGAASAEIGRETASRMSLIGWWGVDSLLEARNERDMAAPGASSYGGQTYDSLARSPDLATVAALDRQGVDFLNPASGRLLERYRIFLNPNTIQEIANLGDHLLLLKERAGVERWDLENQELVRRYNLNGSGLLTSPDGESFALLRGNRLTLVAAESGEIRNELTLTPRPNNYAFSPDGQILAVARGAVAELWMVGNGARAGILYGHGPQVFGLAFTPDGKRLIAASGDIWELASGERIASFGGSSSQVAVSPQGGVFVGDDGSLRDTDSGSRLGTLLDIRAAAAQLLFTPDGRQVLWRTQDGRIYTWGVRGIEPSGLPASGTSALTVVNASRLTLLSHLGRGRLVGAVWSADERYLAVNTTLNAVVFQAPDLQQVSAFLGSEALAFDGQGRILLGGDHPLQLVEVSTGAVAREFGLEGISAAAFSPDGKLLAIAGAVSEGGLRDGLALIDLADGELRTFDSGRGRYSEAIGLEFSPDGGLLALSFYGAISLWDADTAKQLRQPILGNTRPASISPDGQLIAYFTDRFVIENLRTGGNPLTIKADGTPYFPTGLDIPTLRSVDYRFDREGRLAVFYRRLNRRTFEENLGLVAWEVGTQPVQFTVQLEGVLRLTELTGAYANHYATERPQRIPAFGLSPMGDLFYSLTADGVVRVWSVSTGIQQGASTPEPLDLMALTPDGRTVAVPSAMGAIELVELTSGVLQRSLPGEWFPDWLEFGSLSTLAVLGEDGSLTLLDVSNGRLLDQFNLEAYTGPEYLALAQDGREYATLRLAAGRNLLQIFGLMEGGSLLDLDRYPQPHRPAFSPDGRILAMVRRNQVELWDLQSGQVIGRLEASEGNIGPLAFTPDGTRLVAGSGEIWEVESGELAAQFEPVDRTERVVTNGHLIVSESGEIWDIRGGERLGSLGGERSRAVNFSFTPDGSRLVWQVQGGVIELWGVGP